MGALTCSCPCFACTATPQAHPITRPLLCLSCPGCSKLHLIADNFGWFDDNPVNIEDIMREKGQQVTWVSATERFVATAGTSVAPPASSAPNSGVSEGDGIVGVTSEEAVEFFPR